MTLLTIDLGEHLGWTKGPRSADLFVPGGFQSGTKRIRAVTHLGRFLKSADEPLRELFEGVTEVAVEKPDTNGLHYSGIRKNMALLGKVWTMADHFGLNDVIEVPVTQIKLVLAGSGRADKNQMIGAARLAGFMVDDDHEADAIGIRKFVLFGPALTQAERKKAEAEARRKAKAEAAEAAATPKLF